MNIIKELLKSYKEHDGFSLAANISFFSILSLIPLLMITMSIAGYVLGGSTGLFNEVVSALTDILPRGGNEFAANLNNIVEGRSKVGGIGVAVLLFIASFLFSSVEHAMDRIFQSVKKRNFFHSRLVAVLLVFGFVFVLFFPTMIQFFEAALAKFHITIPLSNIATGKMFMVSMAALSFVGAVVIIPNHRVFFRYAFIGGVFFAGGVVLARYVFRLYIVHSFDRYNLIYGSLTVLIVTVIWIYYLANILLLSSELVAVLQRRYSCLNNGSNGDQG